MAGVSLGAVFSLPALAQVAAPAQSGQPAQTIQTADNWTPAEIAAAKSDCQGLLKGLDLDFSFMAPIKHGQCGSAQPVELRAVTSGKTHIGIEPPATLNCKTAAALAHWLADTVQPAAARWLANPVVSVHNAASYDCRNRIGDVSQRLSEHAKANAIDILSFTTETGAVIGVGESWGPTLRGLLAAPPPTPASVKGPAVKGGAVGAFKTVVVPAQAFAAIDTAPSAAPQATPPVAKPDEAAIAAKGHLGSHAIRQARLADAARRGIAVPQPATAKSSFLHAVHDAACGPFGTVLGPEANDSHKDHIHLDMTVRPGSAYCQ